MTPTEIIPWLTLVLSSLAVLGHLKGFFSSGEKKLEADIKSGREEIALLGKDVEAHETKLTSHDRRIQAIEGEMRHLPDRESQHRLELALEKVSAGSIKIASLTDLGRRHVDRQSAIEGVKRPSRVGA